MAISEEKLQSFVHQVVGDLSATTASVMVSLGDKLGLYQAMRDAGPLMPSQVADRAGCAERYVREWLNSQVAGGYLNYHSDSGTYEMDAEQAAVLADEDSPVFMPPAWELAASMWLDEDKALHAFRTGEGVPWGAHNERLYRGTAAFFRNNYLAHLTDQWLPALDGVVEKLDRGGRVADIGCGHGHSTTIMARAFPNSRFHGYDTHDGSIAAARENADAAGVGDRVEFEVAGSKTYPKQGFDLICYFDCLHDMGDPVGAAQHARDALHKDGTVMLVEPFANDRLEANVNPVGRFYYAASTALCCAHSLSEEVGLALGAQAGEARLEEVFRNAGFTRFRRTAETPLNLVLEARA